MSVSTTTGHLEKSVHVTAETSCSTGMSQILKFPKNICYAMNQPLTHV